MQLSPGVYELVITKSVQAALKTLPSELIEVVKLDPAEVHRILARHVSTTLQRVLHQQGVQAAPEERLSLQLRLCGRVLELLEHAEEEPVGNQLVAIVGRDPTGAPGRPWIRPSTPLSDSALLVNANHEPNIGRELEREIESADAIDLLCAFIKWQGLRLLLDSLRRFIARGGRLRVLTSTYLGVTEVRPLDTLRELGAHVRVTYETDATRLHAKAWLFHRESGFTTAYIGSSNLSHSALIDGLEWNVRLSARETPAVIDRFRSAFDTYWEGFVDFEAATFQRQLDRQQTAEQGSTDFSFIEVEPRTHQVQMLYDLEVSRTERGRTRNLVVAATGTGKTLVAAFDYLQLTKGRPGARLLFVAHRQEILRQSRGKFRAVLQDPCFGELLVGGQKPTEWNHVFASIQSLDTDKWTIDPAHFDVVIVDEFHHADAPSYRRVLDRLKPWQLLGLTATPERADGTNVADEFFDGSVAVELRLWDALEQNLLSPFHYFGVGSEADLSGLTFRRGRGYDPFELEQVLTADDLRAAEVLAAADRTLSNVRTMQALGFCVSVRHAEFMAERFNRAGLDSAVVTGHTASAVRQAALARLQSGSLRVLFTVDLFNEGVDIPDVDTLFLLRPTESPTLFLQQLGRGLRKRPGKVLTVLDFVGRQHAEFRFDQRYRALLGGTRKQLQARIEKGAGFLPSGCHFELDRTAKEYVLENLRRALALRWPLLVRELKALGDVPLRDWLAETGFELGDFYQGATGKRGFTALRREANLKVDQGPHELQLARSVERCLHVNDTELLKCWLSALSSAVHYSPSSEREQLKLSMLSALLWDRRRFDSLDHALLELRKHPGMLREFNEVFELLLERVDHHGLPLERPLGVPLHVHCRYSLSEIFAAFGEHRPERPYRTQAGIHYVANHDIDIFFVTLRKSAREYSPTTMYRDYALSPHLFHWESQADQRPEAQAPQRYIRSAQAGRGPLLFVREAKMDDRGATSAYTLLGSVAYVKHEGTEPISFTWHLQHAMPPDVFSAAKAVSG